MKNIAIILLLLISVTFGQWSFDDSYSFEAGKYDTFLYDCPVGMVEVLPSDNGRIEIDVRKTINKHSESEAEDIVAECEIKIDSTGHKLEFKIDLPDSRGRKGRFFNMFSKQFSDDLEILTRIKIPVGIGIEIFTASAQVYCDDLENNLKIDGASSDVELKNIKGNLAMELASGDLKVIKLVGNLAFDGASSDCNIENIEGRVSVNVASGDCHVEDIKGDVSVSSASGNVDACNIEGDFAASSSSGDVLGERFTGDIRAKTTSGSIRLGRLEAREGDFFFKSTSGDVNLELSPDYQGWVEMKTTSGRLETNFEMKSTSIENRRVNGRIGDGKGDITISTVSGDIYLGEY